MMDTRNEFLRLSSYLTGFSRFELNGTGMVDVYFCFLKQVIDQKILIDLLAVYSTLVGENLNATPDEKAFRQQIFNHPTYGPITRNIITMWYIGSWNQLPDTYRARVGINPNDTTHVLSPQTYIEGLAWKAIKAHPMGAKSMGFGSWALPPD